MSVGAFGVCRVVIMTGRAMGVGGGEEMVKEMNNYKNDDKKRVK